MKRILALTLIMCLILTPVSVNAESYVKIPYETSVTVLEVIDGNAIKVRTNDGKYALIRLSLVDTMGKNEAMEYLQNEILGRQVIFAPDSSLSGASDRWNYGFVSKASYSNSIYINQLLVEMGLGLVNEEHSRSYQYSSYKKSETLAKNQLLGIWQEDFRYNGMVYYSRHVNINLFTASKLVDYMEGVNSRLASDIVSFRANSPFATIGELKFVPGFTQELFEKNMGFLTVSTNLNTVGEEELASIHNLTATDAKNIYDYRREKTFLNVNELYQKRLITQTKFNQIAPYLDVTYAASIKIPYNTEAVNINTASRSQLLSAGLSTLNAGRIVDGRQSNFVFNHLSDLVGLSSTGFNLTFVNRNFNSLTVFTDINNCGRRELESLFGGDYVSTTISKIINERPFRNLNEFRDIIGQTKFDSIKRFIYIDDAVPTTSININTATETQLRNYGYTSSEINLILKNQGRMLAPKDVPAGVSYKSGATLYTNINSAGSAELSTLDQSLPQATIEAIQKFVEVAPFASADELSEFFKERDQSWLYSRFKNFIVFR